MCMDSFKKSSGVEVAFQQIEQTYVFSETTLKSAKLYHMFSGPQGLGGVGVTKLVRFKIS